MSTGSTQSEVSIFTEPKQAPERRKRLWADRIRLLGDAFRRSLKLSRRLLSPLLSGAWHTLPSYLPFYLLVIVVGFAAWKARTSVTIIAPFQLPKGDVT